MLPFKTEKNRSSSFYLDQQCSRSLSRMAQHYFLSSLSEPQNYCVTYSQDTTTYQFILNVEINSSHAFESESYLKTCMIFCVSSIHTLQFLLLLRSSKTYGRKCILHKKKIQIHSLISINNNSFQGKLWQNCSLVSTKVSVANTSKQHSGCRKLMFPLNFLPICPVLFNLPNLCIFQNYRIKGVVTRVVKAGLASLLTLTWIIVKRLGEIWVYRKLIIDFISYK